MGKKHHKPKDATPSPWLLKWREAQAFGCIMPDYVPDCPDCQTDRHVKNQPRNNTGIFECRKCQGNIVVLAHMGDETSVLLEEMEDEAKETDGDGRPTVGLGIYAPLELTEEFADAR